MRIFYILFSLLVVGFFVTSGIRPSVQVCSILLFLVLLSYYIFLKLKKLAVFALEKEEKFLFIAFLLMAFSALPPLLVNSSLSIGFSELDLPSKYLLFAFIILLLFKTKPQINKNILYFSICAAGIINGLIALSQLYIFTDLLYAGARVEGFSGINEFGIICGALCVMNLILFIFSSHKYKAVFLIASLLAFSGVVGSGLRGVVLGVVFACVVLFIFSIFTKIINLKTALKYFLSFLLLIGIIGYIVAQATPHDRLEYTQSELEQIKSGDYSSSIGLRLVMYKEALAMFRISPLIGLSAKSAAERTTEIKELSGTDKNINTIGDGRGKRHNDILNFMAKRGIIGLLSLLFFYFAVFNMGWKYLKIWRKNRAESAESRVESVEFGFNSIKNSGAESNIESALNSGTESTNLAESTPTQPNSALPISAILGGGIMLLYIGAGTSGDPLTGHPESTFLALSLAFIFGSLVADSTKSFVDSRKNPPNGASKA
ncbi:hypothetical protein CCY99_05480 [Helicobacter sp. 16-1353]|uniref:O-antigen ligase family protein n=1 Tax=Helicobacter sp. 16-1353 TaxID=2004996 RepID=UPI000DCD2DCE|nr:O-antigen ligase family protein [Helicobacter sp. 16-1353]RAX53833.1 hypothetical protein CCY99_05480 [Helicobacter sp. 16-1353]